MVSKKAIMKSNYNGIDLMKVICSILVVMVHIPPFSSSNDHIIFKYINYFFSNCIGRIAVPLFFITSSYFLFKKIKDNLDSKILRKFICRIGSLYLIWTAIYMPLIIKGKILKESNIGIGIIKFFRDFIFNGSYIHLWYLPSLIVSIIILYILLKNNVKTKNITIIALLLYIIGLLAQSWFGLIKPIENFSPKIWGLLIFIKLIITTTRNGLFDGFVFAVIGYIFAIKDNKLTIKNNFIKIIAFGILLVIECFVLEKKGFIRAHDMYLTLIPLSFYVFNYFKSLNLKDSQNYLYMRNISSLIYFLHLWISVIINKLLKLSENGYISFYLTLFFTIIVSIIIINLSKYKKFNFLKSIY